MPSTLKKLASAAYAASALVVCLFAVPADFAFAAAAGSSPLTGHVTRAARDAVKLERLPADERVDLSFVVRLDPNLAAGTLARIYGPHSAANKRFLRPADFIEQFDLAHKRRLIGEFARASGLVVDADDQPGSLIVKASGPAALVEKAFGVQLNHYRTPGGQVFRGIDTEPSVPSELLPHLNAVLGLTNFHGIAKPHVRHPRPAASRGGAAGAISSAAAPAVYPGTGPGGGLAPADIKTIYGLSGALTGSGQTIALLELDGYASSDISGYETDAQIFAQPGPSPTVTYTPVDGQLNKCGPNQSDPCNETTLIGSQLDEGGTGDDGMFEVALDLDMVIALAHGASNIMVYTAFNSAQNLLDAYAKIAADDAAGIVSTSWGSDQEDAGAAFMTSESAIFQQMAMQGQTIYAAAGDAGAYDASGLPVAWNATLLVDDPASQPFVTGVGGTSLSGTVAGHTEAVWNEGCSGGNSPGSNCAANGAGGGGLANFGNSTIYWPIPIYQSGVAGTYSSVVRNVPDVALNADPDTFPYAIAVGGGFYTIGGTSAAAPLWAAFTALVNQERASGGYGALGFANPPLYQIGIGAAYSSDFNDVTTGDNGYYSAGIGYDDASGWGSFNGNALIGALSTPSAAPVAGLIATTLGTTAVQWSWTAAPDTSYNVYYATNTAQSLARGIQPPFTQTGLLSNATYAILVRSVIDGIEGSNTSAVIATATYANAPVVLPVSTVFATSATFSYSSCPAFPSPASCSGYEIQVSLDSGFSGIVASSASFSPVATPLTLTPLSLNTIYYVRLIYLNEEGAPSFGPYASFTTGAILAAPVSPVFTQISTGSIVFSWGQGSNPPSLSYVAQASTAPNFSGAVWTQSGNTLSAAFPSLSSDASYYFQVQAVGGPFLAAGPQPTLAAPPVVSTNSFPSVGVTGFTLAWSSGSDQADTLYQAEVSPVSNFSSGVQSVQVRTPSAVFSGLVANTLYYAQVEAIGRAGGATGYVSLGSTTTLVPAPTLPAQPFSGQTTNGFTFAFNQTDPPGTRYLVLVSTDPGFSVVNAASNTAAASAAFAGLLSNQLYSVEVAALNNAGAPSIFAVAAPTATAVATPLLVAVPVTTETATGLGIAWNPGILAPGTIYAAQVSSSPAFAAGGFVVTSSNTANPYAILAGLQPNTTYYGQVQALSSNAPNPNGAFLNAAAGTTLANAPSPAAAPFRMVAFTSATVAWTPLPLAPSSAAAEGYLVQFATAPDFSGTVVIATAPMGASSATLQGLSYATTYYARVGSLDWEGLPDYLTLGSTATALPPLSSGTVTGSGLTLIVPPAFAQFGAMTIYVPPGAFPIGTPVSAVANVSALPAAVTNEASAIVPFGSNTGLVLSANGLQPATPVIVTMPYDFTQIPPGQNESHLELWRYDPTALQWTLVPSQVESSDHVLTARTPHFSTFAPYFVAAGTDVNSVQVFPQPWEIGDAASQYWASVLTLSGLPAGATVKIFTIRGELVWSGQAAGSGVLTWDGNNRFGRRAASGTYYASFQNGGQTKVRRLVIIR